LIGSAHGWRARTPVPVAAGSSKAAGGLQLVLNSVPADSGVLIQTDSFIMTRPLDLANDLAELVNPQPQAGKCRRPTWRVDE
jgi:hypothetical protein